MRCGPGDARDGQLAALLHAVREQLQHRLDHVTEHELRRGSHASIPQNRAVTVSCAAVTVLSSSSAEISLPMARLRVVRFSSPRQLMSRCSFCNGLGTGPSEVHYQRFPTAASRPAVKSTTRARGVQPRAGVTCSPHLQQLLLRRHRVVKQNAFCAGWNTCARPPKQIRSVGRRAGTPLPRGCGVLHLVPRRFETLALLRAWTAPCAAPCRESGTRLHVTALRRPHAAKSLPSTMIH